MFERNIYLIFAHYLIRDQNLYMKENLLFINKRIEIK